MSRSKTPMVSVVIPTFNRAWTLAEAIDSVLGQDGPEAELIVVDDGSTDGTPALLAGYDRRITVIRQPNRGVSAARNRGIAAAAGDLIAFLDSDDRWLPGKLSCQAAFFAGHPEAMICQTGEIWVRNGVRVNPKKHHAKPSGWIFEPSLRLCLVSPSAVMVRRALFDAVGRFDVSLPACEDYDLWLRVACRYPVHLLDTTGIVKRGGHPDQLSGASGLDRYRIRSLVNIIGRCPLTPDQRRAAVAVLVEKCAIYAGGCRKRGRPDEADRFERLAERCRGKE